MKVLEALHQLFASPFQVHVDMAQIIGEIRKQAPPLPIFPSQSFLLSTARLPLRIKRATPSSLIRCCSQEGEVMDVIRPSLAEPVGWTPHPASRTL